MHARLERTGLTAFASACETVGGPQIRNLGTIGGQLGTASPAGDVSVALIALDAQFEFAMVARHKRHPMEIEVYSGGVGIVITAAMPLAIGRIGVFAAVIIVIAVQIIAGLVWDRIATGTPISVWRLAGAALVFGGSLLVMRG